MLVIEGADLLGKTTLAKSLVAYLTNELKEPTSYLKLGMESAGNQSFARASARINRWVICDRMHWSEVIYARLARGVDSSLCATDFMNIDATIWNKSGKTLVVVSDPDEYAYIINKTWRDVEEFRKDQCIAVNAEYYEVAMRSKLMAINTDETEFVTPDNFETIVVNYNKLTDTIEYINDAIVKAISTAYATAQQGKKKGIELCGQ